MFKVHVGLVGLVLVVASCTLDPELVARKQQEMEQGKKVAAQQQAEASTEAAAPVKAAVIAKYNMPADVALAVEVVGDWAVASDPKGMKFLCKKQGEAWQVLQAATKLTLPEEAPYALHQL